MKRSVERGKHRLAEAQKLFNAVDNTRASFTVCELAQFMEVRETQMFERASVTEGEDVPTLRPEEQGNNGCS